MKRMQWQTPAPWVLERAEDNLRVDLRAVAGKSDEKWLNRDRFVLSAGHGSMCLQPPAATRCQRVHCRREEECVDHALASLS